MGQGVNGKLLTINGNNFVAGAVVTFPTGSGITAGPTTVVSSILMTVPVTIAWNAAVQPDLLTVTNADAGWGTFVGFTVLASPTLTSVSPVAGPLAGGTAVTITGTNLSGATAVAFNGAPATSVTVASATSISAVV